MFSEPPPDEPDDDVFEELLNELTSTQKAIKGLSPIAVSTTANSLTVFLALVGWFIAPAGRLTALIGAAAPGYVGFKAGQKLRRARRGIVPAAIAEIIQESGIRNIDPAEVAQLASRYGVEAEAFEEQLMQVYGRFLQELVQEDGVRSSEISDLAALRRGLGLRWNATETAHTRGAEAMLDGGVPPGAAATPPALKKLMWLSMTLFASSKGGASSAALSEALGLSPDEAQRIVNGLSAPLYKAAVAQAVGRYNRTETPEKLQAVRAALSLSEQATQQVHNALYDEQLALLLPEGSDTKLTPDAQSLLGELEGVLALRGAAARLEARTLPIYRAAVREALEGVMAGETGPYGKPYQVFGAITQRREELKLPPSTAKASLVEVARNLGAEKLEEAARQHALGTADAALGSLDALLAYGAFLGEMLEGSGYEEPQDPPDAAGLAQVYLGALALETAEAEAQAQALAQEALARGAPAAGREALLRAMLVLTAPELEPAKREYAALLEQFVATGSFDATAPVTRSWQDKLANHASTLPVALRQKLALDAYYTWLSDLSEQLERPRLEQARALRECLRLGGASVAELYSKTAVDQMVLTRCCEQMLGEANGRPLSPDAQSWLTYMERELGSAPGTANMVMAGTDGALSS